MNGQPIASSSTGNGLNYHQQETSPHLGGSGQAISNGGGMGEDYAPAGGQGGADEASLQQDYEISSHLFNAGFGNGDWADIRLEAHFGKNRRVYCLHKLILARSPTLSHFLRMNPNGYEYLLVVSDPNITEDAFCTAIGYLYSSLAKQRLNHDNARSVLAAANFLGLEDLSQLAYDLCRTLIYNLTNPNEIADWFSFLETTSQSNRPTTPSAYHQPYSTPSSPSSTTTSIEQPLLYGAAAYHLRHQLLHYITQTLPTLLAAFGSSSSSTSNQAALNGSSGGMNYQASSSPPTAATNGNGNAGQQALIQVYAVLPFTIFKSVIESSEFPPGDMERFSFAKRCIMERKKKQKSGKDAPLETAVLAFGPGSNSGGSNVQVVSRQKKGSKLWKVEG